MDEDQTSWLNTRQAAAQLGVSARELYRLIDAGELVAYKAGRDLRLRAADVDARRPGPPLP